MPAVIQMLMAATAPIKHIVYTVGNHDKTGAASGSKNPEWVEVLNRGNVLYRNPITGDSVEYAGTQWHYDEGVVHDIDGVRFCVIHHTSDPLELKNKLIQLASVNFDVLVLHQGLVETISLEGKYETTSQDIVDTLRGTGVKLVVCGHIHKAKTWKVGDVQFLSPGATFKGTLDKNEPECSAWLADFTGGQVILTEVPLQQQRKRLFLPPLPAEPDKVEEYAAIIKQLADSAAAAPESDIRKPLVSFSYVIMPGVDAALTAAAGDMVCLDISGIIPQVARFIQDREGGGEAGQVTSIVNFPEVAGKYTKGVALEVLLAVNAGEDPEIAINAGLTKILKGEPA